jgi:hypothetical protein
VPAFGAPEEPYFAFIGSTELAEPPEGEVVFALRAFDLDGGEGFNIRLFIVNNRDLVFRTLFLPGQLLVFVRLDLADIPALAALKLATGRNEQGFTFRTKHRISVLALLQD